jgi:HEAT repeat protein
MSLLELFCDVDDFCQHAQHESVHQLPEKFVQRLRPLLTVLIHDPDPRLHNAVMDSFRQLKRARPLPPLTALLHHPDEAVIKQVMYNVLQLDTEMAADIFISLLHNFPLLVRYYAIKSLGQSENLRAVIPLLRLIDDSNHKIRNEAKAALLRIGIHDAYEVASKYHDNL